MSDSLTYYAALALLPCVALAAAAAWLQSRTAWLAAGFWGCYFFYELGMQQYCSGSCSDRLDLLIVFPLLALLTLLALVQLYVHKRDRDLRRRQRRQRRRTIARDMGS
ncbi:MAG TPA: hypothetical protein VM528_06515 [Burkholderiaceae bacterium]|jgi:hypothetical protein|nr:hypothetical protein [Burkholderiaceae bacterium]